MKTIGTVTLDRVVLGLAPLNIDVALTEGILERVTISKNGELALNLKADQARELAIQLTRAADVIDPRGLGIGRGNSGFVTSDPTRAAVEAYDETW